MAKNASAAGSTSPPLPSRPSRRLRRPLRGKPRLTLLLPPQRHASAAPSSPAVPRLPQAPPVARSRRPHPRRGDATAARHDAAEAATPPLRPLQASWHGRPPAPAMRLHHGCPLAAASSSRRPGQAPGCGGLTPIFLLPFWMWNSIAQQIFSAPILHERLEINEAEALSSWVKSITTNVNR